MSKNQLTLLLGSVALILSVNAHAEIYKWKDAKGVTHYTATPPPQKTIKNKTKVENIGQQIQSAAGKYKVPVNYSKATDGENNGKKNNDKDNKISPPDKKLISYCKNQRKNLAKLKNNFRNVWIAPDGTKTKLDQKQRQEKVDYLIGKITEECKGI